MIHHKEEYYKFIEHMGVGKNDIVASSPKSYLSYLNSITKIIGQDISPSILKNEQDISFIKLKLYGCRADNTIRNYCSAMRQYVKFVTNRREYGLYNNKTC